MKRQRREKAWIIRIRDYRRGGAAGEEVDATRKEVDIMGNGGGKVEGEKAGVAMNGVEEGVGKGEEKEEGESGMMWDSRLQEKREGEETKRGRWEGEMASRAIFSGQVSGHDEMGLFRAGPDQRRAQAWLEN